MDIKTFEQMLDFFDKNIPCKKSVGIGDIILLSYFPDRVTTTKETDEPTDEDESDIDVID